jgi:hypothetical protein
MAVERVVGQQRGCTVDSVRKGLTLHFRGKHGEREGTNKDREQDVDDNTGVRCDRTVRPASNVS